MFSAALYAHVRTSSTIAHETAGAARIRHSLRPLFLSRAKNFQQSSGATRRENAKVYPPSLRAKRSNPSRHVTKESIASSQQLLAMTSCLLRTGSNNKHGLEPGRPGLLTLPDRLQPRLDRCPSRLEERRRGGALNQKRHTHALTRQETAAR